MRASSILAPFAVGAIVLLGLAAPFASAISFNTSVGSATGGYCAGATNTCSFVGVGGTTESVGIIGILVPSTTALANNLGVIFFPLVGAVVFLTIAMMVRLRGDMLVHADLGGLFFGSVVAGLTTQSNAPTGGGLVPWGFVVLTGVIWALWWWNS